MLITTMILTLAFAASISAFAQYGDYGKGGAQTVIKEQLERCREVGIPEFTCTEQTLLAREQSIKAQEKEAFGSGTAMFSEGFGDMGVFIGTLAAIFGGVAAIFFSKARMGRKVPI